MLPDTAYPAPLPLSRAAALELLGRLGDFGAAGAFLAFVEIPVEERIGEWRFAGAGGSLADAVRRVEEFADAMHLNDPERPGGLLRLLLEDLPDTGYDNGYMYPRKAPLEVGVPHRLVLCVQYGAPYEGLGACLVEIASLAGSPFEGLAPETDLPQQWQKDGH
jgi:hypothetical protein